MKNRNSSIELLKIFALILITINHSLPFYGNVNDISYISLGIPTNNKLILTLNLFRGTGKLGDILFIICSSYFLLDSNKTKKEKIFNIVVDSLVISLLWLVVAMLFKIDVHNYIIKSFFPIILSNNWFIGCYLLLYLIHPYLNIIIDKLNRKELLRLNLFLLFLYSILPCIKYNLLYINYLISFIVIYFLTSYIKKYMISYMKNKRLNILILILSISINIIIIILKNYFFLSINHLSSSILSNNLTIIDPLNILIGLSIFNLFINKDFYNNKINYISSLSLIFYLVHENILFRELIKPKFYQLLFLNYNILFCVFIEFVLLLFLGLILSIIYDKTIRRILHKIFNKFFDILIYNYLYLENKLLK